MFDLDEDNIEELYKRLTNLQYLFKLKDLGYDINEQLFGYCGCGECTNDPFITEVIMLVFEIDDYVQVQFSGSEFEIWLEDNSDYVADSEEIEVVQEIYVGDANADAKLIQLILSSYTGDCKILKIDVLEWATGPTWYIAFDQWSSTDDDICDLFLHIRQISLSQEVAV